MIHLLPETKSAKSPQSSPSNNRDILLAAKGGGITFVGSMFATASKFVFGIIVARFLGAADYGLYNLGITVLLIVAAIAILGFDDGLVRFVPIATKKRDEANLRGLIQMGLVFPGLVSLILATTMFVLAKPLAISLFNEPDLAPVLRLISLAIPVTTTIEILTAITRGFKRMEYQVYAQNITLHIVKFLLSVIFLAFGARVLGVVTAYVIASIIAVIMLFYYVHRLFPLNRHWHTASYDIKRLLRFSLPLYLSRLLSRFSGTLETLVLGFFGMTAGVGIYTAALRLTILGDTFFGSLRTASAPIISDLHSQGKFDELGRFYQTVTKWSLLFNLPVFLTVVFYSRPLLSIFGKEFEAGATGVVILAIGSLINAGTGVCGILINMTGYSRLTLINSIIYLVIAIMLDLLFIPRWGVVGAALASGTTVTFINLLRMVEVSVLHQMWPYNKSFYKPVLASLVSAGAVHLINQQEFLQLQIIRVVVGIFVLWSLYAATILILGLSQEDQMVLKKVLARSKFKRLQKLIYKG